MTDSAPSLRSRIKSDLIALGAMSFMAGSFAITTTAYLLRGDMLGWLYAAGAVISAVGAIFVGHRIFSRIP
jgi:drug/metabolite transporter (DMT)-like permease